MTLTISPLPGSMKRVASAFAQDLQIAFLNPAPSFSRPEDVLSRRDLRLWDWRNIVGDRHRITGSAPRILFVSSEVFPLAKTGGLADVCGALPATLSTLGADVRVLLPGYPQALDLAGRLDVVNGRDLSGGRLLMGRLLDLGSVDHLVRCACPLSA